MRRLMFMLVLATGCSDFHAGTPAVTDDAGVIPDATQPMALKPCLDRPTDLARPPTGQLPCELLPPDFK